MNKKYCKIEEKQILTLLQITVDNITYNIVPFLVCDMKCLVRILGLYNVFSPNAVWKCCWCLCDKDHISDFRISRWKFCDIKKMVKMLKSTTKSETAGLVVNSLSNFFYFSYYFVILEQTSSRVFARPCSALYAPC